MISFKSYVYSIMKVGENNLGQFQTRHVLQLSAYMA